MLVGSQRWALDALGNWSEFRQDTNGDGVYGAYDKSDLRTINLANEVTGRTVTDSPIAGTFGVQHDDAGNTTRASTLPRPSPMIPETCTNTDAWNRLTEHNWEENMSGGTITTQYARFEYNGLGWRTLKASVLMFPARGSVGITTQPSGGLLKSMSTSVN